MYGRYARKNEAKSMFKKYYYVIGVFASLDENAFVEFTFESSLNIVKDWNIKKKIWSANNKLKFGLKNNNSWRI